MCEAIVDFDESVESEAKRALLNGSFFMVFEEPWHDNPYVVEDIFEFSMHKPKAPKTRPTKPKYGTTLLELLRFCRNMLVHAGQHKNAVERHFGAPCSPDDLLGEILNGSPRLLIHLYWFAKSHLRHLPHLKFLKKFPVQCAEAYEQLMDHVREEIGPRMSDLLSICFSPTPTFTCVGADVCQGFY